MGMGMRLTTSCEAPSIEAARRLLAEGDADERWEATALLRDAAEREVVALQVLDPLAEEARTAALVEACRLFLEARDPLRALEPWALLPRAAFEARGDRPAPVAAIAPLFGEVVSGFSRALRQVFGAGFSESTLHADQLRVVVESYPGVPELWWALSRRSESPGEREMALARATRLSAALADDGIALAAFQSIEPRMRPRLRARLSPERRGARLTLAVAGRVVTALSDLFAAFTEGAEGGPVELIPAGEGFSVGARGALVLEASAEGLHPFALEQLDSELASPMARASAHPELTLLSLLRESHVELSISTAGCPGQPGVAIDSARSRSLASAAEEAARATLGSLAIPQADDLERVLRALEHVVAGAGGPADITSRQASYYRRAAKLLGLLTEADEPTPAGRLIARLPAEHRLRAAAVLFEASACGDAWIRWSGGRTLLDVSPATAADFIRASVPGLSKDTADRRAQTLASWHRALAGQHYARARSGPDGAPGMR